MRLGETANDSASDRGKPLDGVRILALEQMQALPFATQLMARLGAEVVKIEHPRGGDIGRTSLPAMTDPDGNSVGATFLRNNLSKRSICVDLKHPEGRDLVLELAQGFDVVAENFKSGTLSRMGLGYEDFSERYPTLIYLSVSGFGNTTTSPYRGWPAYAAVAEAMSSLYEWKRLPGQPPTVNPVGALGDIGTSLYGVIGVLAALRHRDMTGLGQHVDIAMFDSMVTFADVVLNFWSMGEHSSGAEGPKLILDGMPAGGSDAVGGWFVIQVGREADFERLAHAVGAPEWLSDPRFSTRAGWREHIEIIRKGVARWAEETDNVTACHRLAEVGVAAGPVLSAEQVFNDPHIAQRNMLVEMQRTDGVESPVLIPGNPIKMSGVAEGPESRVPWLGEHTEEILSTELGIDHSRLAALREDGVIA